MIRKKRGVESSYLVYSLYAGDFKFIMDSENYFKNGKVYIRKEAFAIIKSKKTYPNAFANIIDKNETTVIIEQSKYNNEDIIEIEKY